MEPAARERGRARVPRPEPRQHRRAERLDLAPRASSSTTSPTRRWPRATARPSCSCRTCASTASTRAAWTSAPQGRSSAPSSTRSSSRRTSATAAATASPPAPMTSSTSTRTSNVARKCTLCYDRLQGGMEPACAKACPTDSIQFGELDVLRRNAKKREADAARAGPQGGQPLRRRRRRVRRAERVLPADGQAGGLQAPERRQRRPAGPEQRGRLPRACSRPRCWACSPP